jgi:hypothetical protein
VDILHPRSLSASGRAEYFPPLPNITVSSYGLLGTMKRSLKSTGVTFGGVIVSKLPMNLQLRVCLLVWQGLMYAEQGFSELNRITNSVPPSDCVCIETQSWL